MKQHNLIVLCGLLMCIAFFSCGSSDTNSKETPSQIAEKEKDVQTEMPSEPSNVDVSAGKPVYVQNCAACHQGTGEGIDGVFPPLKGSDFLAVADKESVVKVALNGSKNEDGLAKEITVNGTVYPGGSMMINKLSDEESAEVINYILNSWGNNFGTVTVDDVASFR